jgi:2-oxoglutarate ferredoxin oxidoreductase subunit delta
MADSPVVLDLDLCKACGICIELCPDKVFDRDKLGYPVIARADDCSQCLLCELHCPDFAIEVRRRAKKPAKAASGAPELTRDDLVAATSTTPSPEDLCSHDVEG